MVDTIRYTQLVIDLVEFPHLLASTMKGGILTAFYGVFDMRISDSFFLFSFIARWVWFGFGAVFLPFGSRKRSSSPILCSETTETGKIYIMQRVSLGPVHSRYFNFCRCTSSHTATGSQASFLNKRWPNFILLGGETERSNIVTVERCSKRNSRRDQIIAGKWQ